MLGSSSWMPYAPQGVKGTDDDDDDDDLDQGPMPVARVTKFCTVAPSICELGSRHPSGV